MATNKHLEQKKQTRQKELLHVTGQSLDWSDTTSVILVKTLFCTIYTSVRFLHHFLQQFILIDLQERGVNHTYQTLLHRHSLSELAADD